MLLYFLLSLSLPFHVCRVDEFLFTYFSLIVDTKFYIRFLLSGTEEEKGGGGGVNNKIENNNNNNNNDCCCCSEFSQVVRGIFLKLRRVKVFLLLLSNKLREKRVKLKVKAGQVTKSGLLGLQHARFPMHKIFVSVTQH